MLFFPFTLGTASVRPHTPFHQQQPQQRRPSPKWLPKNLARRCRAPGSVQRKERERGGRESVVDLLAPPPALALTSLRFGGAANHRVPRLIGAVRRLQWCLSALRWWLTGSKCYGNDIYLLLFDPAHSKQPGPVSFPCPGWGMEDFKKCYKYRQGRETGWACLLQLRGACWSTAVFCCSCLTWI